MTIVEAGARRDMGQLDAALRTLEQAPLTSKSRESWVVRLRYAYADTLEAAGREADALAWFHRTQAIDADELTDAAERAAALEKRDQRLSAARIADRRDRASRRPGWPTARRRGRRSGSGRSRPTPGTSPTTSSTISSPALHAWRPRWRPSSEQKLSGVGRHAHRAAVADVRDDRDVGGRGREDRDPARCRVRSKSAGAPNTPTYTGLPTGVAARTVVSVVARASGWVLTQPITASEHEQGHGVRRDPPAAGATAVTASGAGARRAPA